MRRILVGLRDEASSRDAEVKQSDKYCGKEDEMVNEAEKRPHLSVATKISLYSSDPITITKAKVVVGVSGGVDSAVAVWLLLRRGFNVIGCHMRNWDARDEGGPCTGEQDEHDAQTVCEKLNVPFRRVDFVREYWNDVWTETLDSFAAGRTPNPDILCNREIKFGSFLRHAVSELGADYIATGHYARLQWSGNTVQLLSGRDTSKDQSYFLSAVPQNALQKTLFPLGGIHKAATRALARRLGLDEVAEKRSTAGVCFVGRRRRWGDFLEGYLEGAPGLFVAVDDGREVGRHRGLFRYTIGQCARIGGAESSWYVVAKDASSNIITVAPRDHPSLETWSLETKGSFWVAGHSPSFNQTLWCRTRYQADLQRVTVNPHDGGLCITFLDAPMHAVTPDQVAVLYGGDGTVCLGGGVIK